MAYNVATTVRVRLTTGGERCGPGLRYRPARSCAWRAPVHCRSPSTRCPARPPAILTCTAREARSPKALASAILDELDATVLGLFPAWLPDAEGIDGPGGAGLAAVRTLALRTAATSAHFGPFLAELAERALRARPG
ncbi:hypothetical protein ACFSTC_62290 [Nonomuraea ferruginea]